MLSLDITTVLILHMTSLVAGALGFLHLRTQSPDTKGLALFTGAFLGLALGSFSAGLGEQDALPAWIWQPGSLALGCLSYAGLWLAARALSSGRGLRRPWRLLALPIAILGVAALTGFTADNLLRASVFHIIACLCLLAAARDVARDHRVDPQPSRRPLAAILGFAAAVYAGEFLMMTLGQIRVPLIAFGFYLQTFCNFGITILAYGVVKERVENALRLAAEIDPLTGIGNRRWLDARLPGAIKRGDTVMILDLDHFKTVNDRYGHAAGDHVLSVFAEEVRRNLRAQDLFARTGGEEFVLLLPDLSLTDAKAAGERICRLVASLVIQHRGERIPVTTSLGLAWSDGGYPSWDHMLQAADSALYTAKQAGRNRVAVQPPPLAAATAGSAP